MTQRELANGIGIHVNIVSYWCRATRIPNTEQIISIAKFLGVSSDYLLGLTDKKAPDIDMRALCDKTGLTEQAAVNLIKIMVEDENSDAAADALNALFGDFDGLYGLAAAVSGMMEECNHATDYLNQHDDTISGLAKAYKTGKVIDGMELWYFKACEAFRRVLDKAFHYRNIIDDLQREG